jgi:hypothetical protein
MYSWALRQVPTHPLRRSGLAFADTSDAAMMIDDDRP